MPNSQNKIANRYGLSKEGRKEERERKEGERKRKEGKKGEEE